LKNLPFSPNKTLQNVAIMGKLRNFINPSPKIGRYLWLPVRVQTIVKSSGSSQTTSSSFGYDRFILSFRKSW